MPGYTGYKPQFENEKIGYNDNQIMRDNRYYIPGKWTMQNILEIQCNRNAQVRTIYIAVQNMILQNQKSVSFRINSKMF